MIKISDFSNLNSSQKKALVTILTKDKDQHEWLKGIHGEVELEHTIVKHLSAEKYGIYKNEPRYRFEVLDNGTLFKGELSSIHKSNYTLSINENYNLDVKTRTRDTMRLVKYQSFNMRPKAQSIDKQKEVVFNEAKTMSGTSFFHSKPVVFTKDGSYIFMRYLKGTDLNLLINENALTAEERLDLSIELLKALKSQIHDRNHVHRDIKPENILIERSKQQFIVYILDYGFIKSVDYDDSNECKGSFLFAPPECYEKGINKSTASDIYSLGKVLMCLWGYFFDMEKTPVEFKEEASHPHFDDLFKEMRNRPSHQEEIRTILKAMCSPLKKDRPEIKSLLEQFERLQGKVVTLEEEHINYFPSFEEDDALSIYLGFK